MTVSLAHSYWPDIRDLDKGRTVVVVPVGSMEQHSVHLPLGTDTLICEALARKAAELVRDRVHVLVTPALWVGYSPHHLDFEGTVSLSATTLISLVGDICTSLSHHGFRTVLFLNAHGGNQPSLQVAASEVGSRLGITVVAASFWALAGDRIRDSLTERPPRYPGHAGEYETSLALALFPELVRHPLPGPPPAAPYPQAIEEGRATMYRRFASMTPLGNLGDATRARRELGEKATELLVQGIAELLVQLVQV